MDKTITIEEKQSLLDVAIQETGSIETAMELARVNGLSLTHSFEDGGDRIIIPENTAGMNADIRDYYLRKGLKPTTGGDSLT